jgi:hypothetical protein
MAVYIVTTYDTYGLDILKGFLNLFSAQTSKLINNEKLVFTFVAVFHCFLAEKSKVKLVSLSLHLNQQLAATSITLKFSRTEAKYTQSSYIKCLRSNMTKSFKR